MIESLSPMSRSDRDRPIIDLFRYSLLKKFTLVLLLGLLFFGFAIGEIMSSVLRENMINRCNTLTAHLVQHELNNHIHFKSNNSTNPEFTSNNLEGLVRAIDLGPRVQIHDVKVWDQECRCIWSSEEADIGKQNLSDPRLVSAFSGKTFTGMSNSYTLAEKLGIKVGTDQKMELLVPVSFDSETDVSGVFQINATVDKLMEDIAYNNQIVWMSVLTGALLLYLALYGLFRGAAKQIENQNREIRLSEERYRNLIHTAGEGIVAADTNGKILLMNWAAEDMFGYDADEADCLFFPNLFVLEECEPLKIQLEKFMSDGECCPVSNSFDVHGRKRTGETFPLEVSLAQSGDQEHRILTGLIRDVTQQNELMEQLEEAKRLWEEIFNTIRDAITIHDKDFNIIQANKAATEMLGLPMENILGQKCFQSYHGTLAPPAICPSCETLRTGIGSTTEVYEPHLKKHIEVKALPRFDEDHNLIGLVHVVGDITTRKKAEEKQKKLQAQLYQAQKMESIGRLAGGIAHDFNNLLSVIIGYCELTQKALIDDTEPYENLCTIKGAGEKAALLTGQLLAFSRKQVLNMRPIDLNKVVADMTKMLRRMISENITLELKLSPRTGKVVADAGQIEQVLLNLVINARDAMPEGGHLIIETQMVDMEQDYVDQHAEAHLGPHVLLAVTDTGTGIDEKARNQIFDPFFTTKEMGKGTGLGLATVYGIVKQHGGQIYVYSEAERGTTFKIYLPATPNAEVESLEQAPSTIPTGNETILIAEDDDSIRKMIHLFLEPMGYTVLLARNGEEAVKVSREHDGKIDILLTDVIMPNLNGQELANELKSSRPDMAVIFMSGYTDDVVAHHGVLTPGVNFIQKPITLSRLAHKLREVLKKL